MGSIRISMELECRPASCQALVLNASLPANLRIAGPAHRPHLLADIPANSDSFSRNLSQIRQGLRLNPDGTREGVRPQPGDSEPYKSLFASLREGDGSLDVVDRDPGWELGPRVGGARVPVRVSPERNGLRLYRIVLKTAELSAVETGPEGRSVADMALRLNELTRFVRLARLDSGVVVEARLSQALVDVERVTETANAIAVVSAAVRLPLQILLQIEGVARCYADTFNLTNGEA
jgi:hypothetical protein